MVVMLIKLVSLELNLNQFALGAGHGDVDQVALLLELPFLSGVERGHELVSTIEVHAIPLTTLCLVDGAERYGSRDAALISVTEQRLDDLLDLLDRSIISQ